MGAGKGGGLRPPFLLGLLNFDRRVDGFLGSLWEALGTSFGTLLGSIWCSGPVLEALRGHLGGILDPFGRLSVSTSFVDPKNYQNMLFFDMADVVKTY